MCFGCDHQQDHPFTQSCFRFGSSQAMLVGMNINLLGRFCNPLGNHSNLGGRCQDPLSGRLQSQNGMCRELVGRLCLFDLVSRATCMDMGSTRDLAVSAVGAEKERNSSSSSQML